MSKRSAIPFLLCIAPVAALGVFGSGCENEEPMPTAIAANVPKMDAVDPGSGELDARAGGPGFFPLHQGDRWQYARRAEFQVFPDGGDPQESIFHAQIEQVIDGTEARDGLTYAIMERRWDEEGDQFTQWVRVRQDKAGLYEATVPLTEPPVSGLTLRSGSAPAGGERLQALNRRLSQAGLDPGFGIALETVATRHERVMALLRGPGGDAALSKASHRGGPQSEELFRLAYPLHPKSQWTVLQDPEGKATVEAREVMNLPAGKMQAWRIRLEWDFLEPGDRVHVWYGRCGMLKLEAHTEGEATDEGGQPIGRVVSEESEVLVDLDVQQGGCP